MVVRLTVNNYEKNCSNIARVILNVFRVWKISIFFISIISAQYYELLLHKYKLALSKFQCRNMLENINISIFISKLF